MELNRREDWTLFRSLGTLPQMAGVETKLLTRLVAKELVDNALDAGASCEVDLGHGGTLEVRDDGEGIEGTPDEIAALFSFGRALTSSKQLRRPTRGALGNGLRVVTGLVCATRGNLIVATKGRALKLTPHDDGHTQWEELPFANVSATGTLIMVQLGENWSFDTKSLLWAERAILMNDVAKMNESPSKRRVLASSAYWYDDDAFFELCQAFGGFARDLVAMLDGCAHPKAGKIAATFHGRAAASLSRDETTQLLRAARQNSMPVVARRLGFVGDSCGSLPLAYAKATGSFSPDSARGDLRAQLPFVVEVWAERADVDHVEVNVNRTPIAAHVDCRRARKKTELTIYVGNLGFSFDVGRAPIHAIANVQTPYMPIMTAGKAPDLKPMLPEIAGALKTAATKAGRIASASASGSKARSQTAIVRQALPTAMKIASGDGQSRYSLRQLFYQVRPFILNELKTEPNYNTFCDIITRIEEERGQDLEGIYRDTRGTLYHPHTGEEMSLGTLTVETYARPLWTFNKILYSEKEGFFQLLKDAKWPERHDCALLTAKGQPTRAARDILDLLGETNEEITFFCIHDADAAGTIIYQSLQEATKARAARNFRIINLGLEPLDGLEMELGVENIEPGKKRRSVANYVTPEWEEWLQTKRIELNAMTSPQFVQWLDEKMAQYDSTKIVPPSGVLRQQFLEAATTATRENIEAEILAAADIDNLVNVAMKNKAPILEEVSETLEPKTRQSLQNQEAQWWASYVGQRARQVISD